MYLGLERYDFEVFVVNSQLCELLIGLKLVLEGNFGARGCVSYFLFVDRIILFQKLLICVSKLESLVQLNIKQDFKTHDLILKNICKLFAQISGANSVDISICPFSQLRKLL
jgi:hypothetical protein